MHTQYSRLLDGPALPAPSPLLRRLHDRDPAAEREIARRFNRKHKDRRLHIAAPPDGAAYDAYPPRLLALLWALAHNTDALAALARSLGTTLPADLDLSLFPDALLEALWGLGRDGDALAELWRRQRLLPVVVVHATTPEPVLGFLAWYHHRADAFDELLRRYGLYDLLRTSESAAEHHKAAARFLERFRFRRVPPPYQSAHEFAGVVSAKLVVLVRQWDYVAYPSLEHLLVKAVHNQVRDDRRRRRLMSLSTGPDRPPDPPELTRVAPSSAAELQDFLARRLPLEERVIRKAQNGIELTDEELTWALERNLAARGVAKPTKRQRLAARVEVIEWLAEHPAPSGKDLAGFFPWYRPTAFGKAARSARLLLLCEAVRNNLRLLLRGAEPELREAASQLERCLDELLRRAGGAGRPERAAAAGPVACFTALEEARDRLFDGLAAPSLTEPQADALERCREDLESFLDHFPILRKLAACRRLVAELTAVEDEPAAAALRPLAAWLDGGQQWLSSFHQEDKAQAAAVAESLRPYLDGRPPAAGAALRLLRLWLAATGEPGAVEPRLGALDLAWRQTSDAAGREALAELIEQAHRGRWDDVSHAAERLLAIRAGPSADGEPSRLALLQLRSFRPRPRQQEACGRLVAYLHDSGEPFRWLAAHGEELLGADDGPSRLAAEVSAFLAAHPGDDAPAARATLQLLGLWLRPPGASRLAEPALEALDLLWRHTHDPWYDWPAETAGRVRELIAFAAAGEAPALAAAARRLLRQFPDESRVGRGAAEEFRAALQRLARVRGVGTGEARPSHAPSGAP